VDYRGQACGKDSVASLIAAWFAALCDYDGLLRSGEAANIMCLANDRIQAKIVLNCTRAFFDRIELFRPLVQRETAEGFVLLTGAEITVMPNNYRAVRGRSMSDCNGDPG
jgi:hypothetical protein